MAAAVAEAPQEEAAATVFKTESSSSRPPPGILPVASCLHVSSLQNPGRGFRSRKPQTYFSPRVFFPDFPPQDPLRPSLTLRFGSRMRSRSRKTQTCFSPRVFFPDFPPQDPLRPSLTLRFGFRLRFRSRKPQTCFCFKPCLRDLARNSGQRQLTSSKPNSCASLAERFFVIETRDFL